MSGVNTRANHPSALWPGVNAHFGLTYKEKPMKCEIIFSKKTSRKHYEEDVESGGLGLATVKNESQSIAYDSSEEGYKTKYRHVTYGLGTMISREAIEDNLYKEKALPMARAMARSMRQTKEILHAGVLNNGFNAANPIGDGSALLAVDHRTQSGTGSNVLAVAADLSEASLEQALIDIRGFTDTRGLQMAFQGERLIVPRQLVFIAERIMKTNLRVGTDLNDINAIKAMGLLPRGILTWDFLTDPDAWFIQTDASEGFKTFQRRAIEFKKDNDFDTENAKMKTTERYSFGASDWRCVFGSPGA